MSETMVRHPGEATAEGTRNFRAKAIHGGRLPAEHFRRGPGDLSLTSLGIGTYLGRPDLATDLQVEAAVRLGITSGRVNVIDTAINYRNQRAERAVGRAVHALIDSERVKRSEVFVATKVGYLAPDGESGVPASEWVRRELIEPGVLDPVDVVEGSHAMSPSYLRDQVDRSRANLGLETLDLVYLHNAPDAQLASLGPERFLERLRLAFSCLEELRSSGVLQSYGLATWASLLAPPDDPGFFPLESAVRLAEELAGPAHGFRFVQFPVNIALPEAVTFANQPVHGVRLPALEAAVRLNLGVFSSVPLMQGELARSGPHYGSLSRAASAIQWARSAPGTIAPLLGLKTPEHLSEGLAVAALPPWPESEFRSHVARAG